MNNLVICVNCGADHLLERIERRISASIPVYINVSQITQSNKRISVVCPL